MLEWFKKIFQFFLKPFTYSDVLTVIDERLNRITDSVRFIHLRNVRGPQVLPFTGNSYISSIVVINNSTDSEVKRLYFGTNYGATDIYPDLVINAHQYGEARTENFLKRKTDIIYLDLHGLNWDNTCFDIFIKYMPL